MLCLTMLAAHPLAAQSAPDPERWNLYFQATSIGQYHGSFRSPYSDAFSLANHPEAEVSITSTLFLGLRLRKNTQLYCDPEMAGGRGFSGTNGIANFPNGEMPRVATATPKPYLARLYVTQDFGFGDRMEQVESDANRSAHAVHGLGHNVQRRMGLPGRHSRLHLGLDA